jgi:hypothetical protein
MQYAWQACAKPGLFIVCCWVQLPITIDPKLGAASIALLTFITLTLGENPGLKLNRATIAMVGYGSTLIFGMSARLPISSLLKRPGSLELW